LFLWVSIFSVKIYIRITNYHWFYLSYWFSQRNLLKRSFRRCDSNDTNWKIKRANIRVREKWRKCVNCRSKEKSEEDLIRPIHAFTKGVRRFHIGIVIIHVPAPARALAPVYIAHEICKRVCSPFRRAGACSSLDYYSLLSRRLHSDSICLPVCSSIYHRETELGSSSFLSLSLSLSLSSWLTRSPPFTSSALFSLPARQYYYRAIMTS